MPQFIAPMRWLRHIRDYPSYDEQHQVGEASTSKLTLCVAEVVSSTWDLGFTAFGGPPVHFQILYRRFVMKEDSAEPGTAAPGKAGWVDEQTVGQAESFMQRWRVPPIASSAVYRQN